VPAKSLKIDPAAEIPTTRRNRLSEHAAATLKVILLTGGLLGGLWLLQMIAKT
jgi:hypothetical protein